MVLREESKISIITNTNMKVLKASRRHNILLEQSKDILASSAVNTTLGKIAAEDIRVKDLLFCKDIAEEYGRMYRKEYRYNVFSESLNKGRVLMDVHYVYSTEDAYNYIHYRDYSLYDAGKNFFTDIRGPYGPKTFDNNIYNRCAMCGEDKYSKLPCDGDGNEELCYRCNRKLDSDVLTKRLFFKELLTAI